MVRAAPRGYVYAHVCTGGNDMAMRRWTYDDGCCYLRLGILCIDCNENRDGTWRTSIQIGPWAELEMATIPRKFATREQAKRAGLALAGRLLPDVGRCTGAGEIVSWEQYHKA